jgi:transposase-like protein
MSTKEERLAALNTAIERAGGAIRLAEALGITHQAIYAWRKRGWVPADKAIAVENLVGVPRISIMDPALVAVLTAPPSQAADIL